MNEFQISTARSKRYVSLALKPVYLRDVTEFLGYKFKEVLLETEDINRRKRFLNITLA
jgi:hypothetical protein